MPALVRLARLLLLTLCLCPGIAPAARAGGGDSFATLPYLAETDPDAALERIARLTGNIDPASGFDPRAAFDLYRMAASLMIEAGQVEQAAQAIAKLADFAVHYRDTLGFDPVPIYGEAAALLRDTGQPTAARDTLISMYGEQRSAGATPEALGQTARDIADLSAALGMATPDLPDPLAAGDFQTIPVYYFTDRGQSGDPEAPLFYAPGRGEPEWGIATVSRPKQEGAGDVSKLRAVQPMAQPEWLDRLRSAPEQGALVYVPGASTRFEQGARRAALIAQALGGAERAILFSWPASGSTLDYMADSAATRTSARQLARMLEGLAAQPGPARPHLLARGMGAQVLADALELIAARRGEGGPEQQAIFGQLIFAIPDMDAERFRDLLPVLRPLVQRITLYTSQDDSQLALARQIYGPALRAGWGGEATLTDPAVDSVDLAAPGAEMPGPEILDAEILSADAVLADIAMLLWKDAPPARRCGLVATPGEDQPVWRWQDGLCAHPDLIRALARLRQEDVQTQDLALEVLRAVVPDADLRDRLAPVVSRLLLR
ncbi:alpha/beta hydrolase [Antarcticimicrobium sediminis]|nr:alpha/beta hydrolase [Antarcticimicrobium sediminis]